MKQTVKKLLPTQGALGTEDTLELIKLFANTWFSLDAYDRTELPTTGATKRKILITADELQKSISSLKQKLMDKNEATQFFAQEKQAGSIQGIVGNIFLIQ
jgi:hypothetical protein